MQHGSLTRAYSPSVPRAFANTSSKPAPFRRPPPVPLTQAKRLTHWCLLHACARDTRTCTQTYTHEHTCKCTHIHTHTQMKLDPDLPPRFMPLPCPPGLKLSFFTLTMFESHKAMLKKNKNGHTHTYAHTNTHQGDSQSLTRGICF